MEVENRQINNEEFFKLVKIELEECGSVRFRIKGWSMQPLMRHSRDEVVLKPLNGYVPMVGDVCLFRCSGKHIMHRLIRYEGDTLVMRGDNNAYLLERCKLSDVVGIVTAVFRDGKEVSPISKKWLLITIIHRLYLHTRLTGAMVLRKLHLRK